MYGGYNMSEQIKLSPEEEKKSYSKYFYKEPGAPDKGALEKMAEPMDPSKALPITKINDLLNPGYFEVEAGWCMLPQGGLYVSNYTRMPGVTVDMFNWWFWWHSLEDARYKIWWPHGHFGISVSDRDRAIITDPRTPVTERFQGRTHFVLENTGGPSTEKIAISFMTPEMLGFDMSRFRSPNVGTVVGANGVSLLLNPPPGAPVFKTPACMLHFIREIDGGVELRTRFWIGYHILDKKPQYSMPKGAMIPPFVAQGLAMHNVLEFSNLRSFLPQIYAEEHDKAA
jgi:phloretin hydrolase